jgi:hypothetical protein
MQGASDLAGAFLGDPIDRQSRMVRWAKQCDGRLKAWAEVVDFFYDGRLIALIQQGEDNDRRWPTMAPLGRFFKRTIGATMVGVRTESSASRWVVRQLAARILRDHDPKDWAIRGLESAEPGVERL